MTSKAPARTTKMANPDLWLSAIFVLLQFMLLSGLIRQRRTKPVAEQVAGVLRCDVCAGDELLREVLEADRTAATERVNPSPRPILERV
jgi:hypothetical protein